MSDEAKDALAKIREHQAELIAELEASRKAQAERVGNEARAAWDAGRIVFTPTIIEHDDLTYASQVQDVLAVGWRLDTWTMVGLSGLISRAAVPLFVRPGAAVRIGDETRA